MNKKNIAVVGATGLVGRTILRVLEERDFPVNKLVLLSSERTAGSEIKFRGENYKVEILTENSFKDIDIALFSAGGTVSKKFATIAANEGCIVIDNSSAWRLHPNVPLIVPEVNSHLLKNYRGIIANPNCSTIQLMVALKPIDEEFTLKRVVVSTYQSISGAGQKGVDKLVKEINNETNDDKHTIAFSTMFHDIDDPNGFSDEELKMINESRKILDIPELQIAITCVRLPILGGHGESVNIETKKECQPEAIRELLSDSAGVVVMDEPSNQEYPTPQISNGTDSVYVGRIRKDPTVKHGAYLWIVADNVRKGAATNAVQIAELYL